MHDHRADGCAYVNDGTAIDVSTQFGFAFFEERRVAGHGQHISGQTWDMSFDLQFAESIGRTENIESICTV